MNLPRDLGPIEWRRRRSGWFGRCPRCARFSRRIIILGRGVYVCPRCRENDHQAATTAEAGDHQVVE